MTTNTLTPDATRIQVLTVANTYGCMCQFMDMVAFFSNSNNSQATYDAVQVYGMPPRNGIANDGSYHPSWCSWDLGMYKFYLAAKLYSKYPKFDFKNPINCEKTNALKISLDEEKVYLDKLKLSGGGDCGDSNNWYKYAAIVTNDYMSEVNGALGVTNCTKVIDQQQQEEQLDIINKTANSGTSEQSTSKTGLYIVYGIALLIAGIVVKKIFFK